LYGATEPCYFFSGLFIHSENNEEIGGANGYAGFSKNNEVITNFSTDERMKIFLSTSKIIIKTRIGNNLETICINGIFDVSSVPGLLP